MRVETEKDGTTLVSQLQGTELLLGLAPVAAPASLKQAEPVSDRPEVLEELVIEEVSIDGMCGVY